MYGKRLFMDNAEIICQNISLIFNLLRLLLPRLINGVFLGNIAVKTHVRIGIAFSASCKASFQENSSMFSNENF